MANAKQDYLRLLDEVVDLADKQLRSKGELLPFATALTTKGEMVRVATSDGIRRANTEELMDLVERGLRRAAGSGKFLATAMVYETMSPSSSSEGKRAIAVELEHAADNPLTLHFPYWAEDERLEIAAPHEIGGCRGIFARIGLRG